MAGRRGTICGTIKKARRESSRTGLFSFPDDRSPGFVVRYLHLFFPPTKHFSHRHTSGRLGSVSQ